MDVMLKSKYFYACLAAGLVLGIPFTAVARLSSNGTSMNGTALNPSQITPVNEGVLRVEGGQLVIQTSSVTK